MMPPTSLLALTVPFEPTVSRVMLELACQLGSVPCSASMRPMMPPTS